MVTIGRESCAKLMVALKRTDTRWWCIPEASYRSGT